MRDALKDLFCTTEDLCYTVGLLRLDATLMSFLRLDAPLVGFLRLDVPLMSFLLPLVRLYRQFRLDAPRMRLLRMCTAVGCFYGYKPSPFAEVGQHNPHDCW